MKRRTKATRERARIRFLRDWGRAVVFHLDLPELIDTFLFARYRAHMPRHGEPTKRTKRRPTREASFAMAQRFMLLEHGVNRDALEASLTLGGLGAFFETLWEEDDRIGPRGAAA